ncbi:MAG: LamG domain-containing protein [Gammaproteobacteria bacterium]|nr:LamG domain-containing protein [Gammaproteobacteria bacterium]
MLSQANAFEIEDWTTGQFNRDISPINGKMSFIIPPGSSVTTVGSNSYKLDGINQYVSIADHDDLSPAGGLSVCDWVESDSISANDGIVSKQAGEYELRFSSNDRVFFRIYTDGSNYIGRSTATFAATTGTWNFWCGTWDGTAASTGVDILKDCVAVDSANQESGTFTGLTNGANDLYIGRHTAYHEGNHTSFIMWSDVISAGDCTDARANKYSGLAAGTKTNLVFWIDAESDLLDKHNASCGGGGCDGTAQNGVAPASPADPPTY